MDHEYYNRELFKNTKYTGEETASMRLHRLNLGPNPKTQQEFDEMIRQLLQRWYNHNLLKRTLPILIKQFEERKAKESGHSG